jgi:poly(beta-D-mannuronate) lyase
MTTCTGDRAAAQCTLAWLGAWADDGAMLGQMIRVNNNQSFYMRQWMLDAVAMAYLKVHDQADARQRARIDPWLQRLARANLAYWNNPKRRRNNHYYWGGLGVLATGLATDDDALWQAGHAAFQKGIDDIQDDGSLPLEMARGQRPALPRLRIGATGDDGRAGAAARPGLVRQQGSRH